MMKKEHYFYIFFLIILLIFFIFIFNILKKEVLFQPAEPVIDEINPSIIYSAQATEVIIRGHGFTQTFSLNALVNGTNFIIDQGIYTQEWVNSEEIILNFPAGLPPMKVELSIINDNNIQSNSLYFEVRSGQIPPESRVWFGPVLASQDYHELFTQDNLWAKTRKNIDVFLVYSEALFNTSIPCAYCGSVSYQSLIAAGAFDKLRQWNIPISTYTASVKHWGCTAEITVPVTELIIHNLEATGNNLSYLSMDEPYIGGEYEVNGESCNYSMEQSAEQTALYINAIRTSHPDLQIGDAEPYPYFSAQEIMDWVLALEGFGAQLDFFHLDANHDLPINISEMQQLKSFFENKNITFGVLYFKEPFTPTSNNYFDRVSSYIDFLKNNNLEGTDHYFQSWNGDGLPINLPEDALGVSHTNLILQKLGFLLDDDALFVSQNVPSEMVAGQTYSVSITMLNNGKEVWSGKKLYGLGSQGPQDNSIWGLGRATLTSNEKVYPGEQKTFTFSVTAPITPGNYNFEWQMLHEEIEWFGMNSPSTSIIVNQPPHIDSISPISILNNIDQTITITGTGLSQNFFLLFAPASNPSAVNSYCDFVNFGTCQWVSPTEFRFTLPQGTTAGEVIFGYVNLEGFQISNPSEVFTIQASECFASSTRPCGNNIGECTGAIQTCTSGGTWGPCAYGLNYESIETQCTDGLDNDCNGVVDSCAPTSPQSGGGSSGGGGSGGGSSGRSITLTKAQCNDKIDNDGDGFIDYPNDLGCESIIDGNELDAIRSTNTNTNEENSQELNGNTESVNLRVIFWGVVLILISGIVALSRIIIKNLKALKSRDINRVYSREDYI